MKNKLLLLLKNNFLNTYKIKSMSKKKLFVVILLAIYVIGTIMISLGMFMNTLYKTLNEANMINYYITIVFSISSLFALFFNIFSAKSGLFGNKDNNLLFSLPVKRSEIITSRLIMLIGYNFVIGLLFIIPSIYIYLQYVSINLITLISIFVLTIFFSIIPTVISSLFGYLVAYLTSKTNAKSMFELLFYTLFIFIYIYVMNNSNKLLEVLISNPKTLDIILKTLFLPIYFIHQTISTNNFLYLIGFILINLAILYLFVIILNINYLNIITKLTSQKTKSNFKMTTLKSTSIKKSLLKKEFSKYFSSAIYVFNTIFGVAFMIIVAIASFVYTPDKLFSMVGMSNMSSYALVFMLLTFAISLTDTTNSSISIEKENFWIMKMIPVNTKDIFNAKTTLNKLILIPIAILSLILLTISGYITQTELLLLSVFTITYGSFIANFGLIANLLFPKLDAPNDTVIVKQSAASMVGILGGIVIFAIMLAISNIKNINNLYSISICIVISLILYIVSKIILNKWGVKRFKEIN